MSDDLQDLVTSNDLPMMTKQEMRKTHANQHEASMMNKKATKKKPANKKKK